jgi:prepilin-type N-terminal cleavage/methylation domain-containing protein
MNSHKLSKAFTLIELLVVISIIAILASIALPVFSGVQERGQQTKCLSNVKQILLGLRLYAQDNNGSYPSYVLKNLKPDTASGFVKTSNDAFAQLFPDYTTNEQIFWEPKSGYNLTAPDNLIDNPQLDSRTETLKKGECSFAYVLGLSDTSNPSFPVVADAFADVSQHTYTTTENKPGGVWKGKKALIGFVDGSAQLVKTTALGGGGTSFTVNTSPKGGDLFNTSETNWLTLPTGATSIAVNPDP